MKNFLQLLPSFIIKIKINKYPLIPQDNPNLQSKKTKTQNLKVNKNSKFLKSKLSGTNSKNNS